MWPAVPAPVVRSDLAEHLRALHEHPVPISQDDDGDVDAVLVSRTFSDRAYGVLEDVEYARLVAERLRIDDQPRIPLREILDEFAPELLVEFGSDSDLPTDKPEGSSP